MTVVVRPESISVVLGRVVSTGTGKWLVVGVAEGPEN